MVNLLAIESQTIIMLVLLAVMVVVLIVLPMFTNRRRNKAINDLHSSLRPGDVIKTVGGIVGKIVEIREISPVDKEMVVETGVEDNKCTMVFDVQAVYQVLSKVDAPVEENTVATTVSDSDGEIVSDPVAENTASDDELTVSNEDNNTENTDENK